MWEVITAYDCPGETAQELRSLLEEIQTLAAVEEGAAVEVAVFIADDWLSACFHLLVYWVDLMSGFGDGELHIRESGLVSE